MTNARGQTPAQTLGPFFHGGLVREAALASLADAATAGERIHIEGVVYDGAGEPIVDALLEVWQADADGHYHHVLDTRRHSAAGNFTGFGRAATNAHGLYVFDTIRPGAVPGPDGGWQAPHLNLIVGARGMARLAFTRLYFEPETPAGRAALVADPVLRCVPAPRQPTLIARAVGARSGSALYRFDIHLQGARETVFFEF